MRKISMRHSRASRRFWLCHCRATQCECPRIHYGLSRFSGAAMSVPRLSVAIIAAFMLMLNGCSRDSDSTLSAPDAYAMAQSGKLTLIDVQRPDEWKNTGIAQGALHIDMSSTQGEAGFIQQVSDKVRGDKRTPIG